MYRIILMSLITLFNLSGKPKKELLQPKMNIGRDIISDTLDGKKIEKDGIAYDHILYVDPIKRYRSVFPAIGAPLDNSNPCEIYSYGAGIVQARSPNLNRAGASVQLSFPHESRITQVHVVWYRDDALAAGYASLSAMPVDTARVSYELLYAHSNLTTGYHEITTNVSYEDAPVVDITKYNYILYWYVDPNNSIDDVRIVGARFQYEIVKPDP